jgi:uncharacterized membrane protein
VPRLILLVFLAWSLAATVAVCAGWNPPPQWQWVEALLPLLAALAALGSLAPRLPLQNLLAIGGLVLGFSTGLLACAAGSRFPFGPIQFAEDGGLLLLKTVPVSLSFWWVALLVSSRETARLILRLGRHPRNHGLHIVALAAVLVVVADVSWEPFAVQVRGLWHWNTSAGALAWYSAPWVNFVGWFGSTLLLLGFTAPWFIAKRPVRSIPRFDPALVWLALNLHFIAGNAARGLWAAVGVGGGLVAAVGWLAWCGIGASEKGKA